MVVALPPPFCSLAVVVNTSLLFCIPCAVYVLWQGVRWADQQPTKKEDTGLDPLTCPNLEAFLDEVTNERKRTGAVEWSTEGEFKKNEDRKTGVVARLPAVGRTTEHTRSRVFLDLLGEGFAVNGKMAKAHT